MLFMFEIAILSLMLFFISYPLFRRKMAGATGDELLESDLSDLLYKKESSYIALKDLEFDFKTGKIDDNDYASMKAQLESEAMTALQMIEDYSKEGTGKEGSGQANKRSKTDKRFCPSCGNAIKTEHKFCSSCGSPL
ncbi:hypothetical protein MNBD_NITROSPINAE02-17 [hydrothermal vent metagenome]|uniref:Zinc-ribbon domain-containing protein n=1 Tax=hydrothermal vent metagenome TaxID=652676 RepID=A0A3B1CLY2_9ZZZZ